jgi:3-deoxy-manno-octulosonate cytidylyltransferase (CMP-KDO synthetase)
MRTAIVIPARFGSTRFEGKPLHLIAGKSLLARVVDVARRAGDATGAQILVATDDERIAEHAHSIGAPCALTSTRCATGSDRVREAVAQLREPVDFVLNLQGDAPFTPWRFLVSLCQSAELHPSYEVFTPVVRLSWEALDQLRAHKASQPFSGTTVIVGPDDRAIWFSKNIIPCIRNEADVRRQCSLSPVYRHIGLYGYRTEALNRFTQLDVSTYEAMESIEALRFVENSMPMKAVPVSYLDEISLWGIDTPEDAQLAEELIRAKRGHED